MNPIYALRESPNRGLILASLSFGIGVVGAMATLAYDWPHPLGRIWFYLWAIATVAWLVFAFIEWRARVEEELRIGSGYRPGETTTLPEPETEFPR